MPDSILADTTSNNPDSLKTQKEQVLKANVTYHAEDSIRFDIAEQKVYLYGNAEVLYEDIQLKAAYIEYSFVDYTVLAKGEKDSTGTEVGKPVFSDKGNEFKAKIIRYNFQSKKGLIQKVITNEGEGYIHSEVTKKQANDQIHIRKAKYTTCDKENPHYHFHLSKAIIIPNEKIVSGPTYLKFRKIPTPLAIPFGFFPNQNRSTAGIILPSYGESEQLGFFFQGGGYYLPISNSIDNQLTGDIYTKGSWALNNLTRYKKRYRYNGNLLLNYLVTRSGDPELPNFSRQTSFSVKWNHRQDASANPRSYFSASVNAGSTNRFTNNLSSSTSDYLSNTFASDINYNRNWNNNKHRLTFNMGHDQNSKTGTFSFTIPNVNFNVNRFFPLAGIRTKKVGPTTWYEKIGVNYNSSFKNTLTVNDTSLSLNNTDFLLTQMKNGVQHNANATTSLNLWHFSVDPSFNLAERWYFRTIEKSFDPETLNGRTDTIPGFRSTRTYGISVKLTTRIYGMFQYKGKKIKAIRHVLTPTVGFSYNPDFDKRETGFFENDSTLSSYSPFAIGAFPHPNTAASGRLNFNLGNNLEMKVNTRRDTGSKDNTKIIRLLEIFNISTNYDMIKDSLRWANIGLKGTTNLTKGVNLNYVGVLNPYARDSLGNTINQSLWSKERKLGTMTTNRLALNVNFKSKNKQNNSNSTGGLFSDFTIPWTFGAQYSVDIQKSFPEGELQENIVQTLGFNGTFELFKMFRFNFFSGYDFVNQELSYTSTGLYIDLHCWELQMNYVPFGPQQSYNIKLNIKAQILSDLKIERKRNLSNENLLF